MLNPYFHRYNAYFIPGEHRRRHRAIDRVIENTHDALKLDEVKKSMGVAAFMLSRVVDMLYVPNIRNGKAIIPAEYADKDKISLVALARGEYCMTKDLPPMPLQYSFARQNAISSWREQGVDFDESDLELLAEKMYKPDGHWKLRTLDACEAVCSTPRDVFKHNSDRYSLMESFGRPDITVKLDSLRNDIPESSASTLVHEMTHARERILQPQRLLGSGFTEDKGHLYSELIAYNAEGLFIRGLCGEETARRIGGFALQIDSLRALYNGEDFSAESFYPSDDLEMAFKNEKLDFIYKTR